MNSNVKNAIDAYKCKIPSDRELTNIFDLINESCQKLREKEEACNYLQRILDEAPANIKERIRQKQLAAERKEKISDRIWQIGFVIGVALMIILPITGINFWLECIICICIVMGAFFYSIYYKNGRL